MKLALNNEMREIDRVTIEKYGIPGIVLMENAGRAVVDEMNNLEKPVNKVLILCGTGNNGGDGFVIARHLHNAGVKIRLFIVGQPKDITGDASLNLQVLRKLDIQIDNVNDQGGLIKLEKLIPVQDVVVDAIFGTGLSKDVQGIHAGVIDVVNRLSACTVSVDVPSGISGDTGRVMGRAVKAHKTVTFALPKLGNIMYPGADYNGELVVRQIGLPQKAMNEVDMKHHIITEERIVKLLPERPQNSHKGTYGKAHVIAGSSGMTGAAILTCKAALRSGLGLLKLYIPESLNLLITTSVPEVVTIPLNEMRRGVININQITKIIKESAEADVVAIGPGCGMSSEMSELVRQMLDEVQCPMVIDADGLNVLAKNVSWLDHKKAEIVLTPHPGEMARLTGLTVEEISDNPIDISREFAQKHGVILILKGSRTIIAMPQGDVFVNLTGNSGMATAGSGDVLTGIITGFIAQGMKPSDAVLLSVHIHGRSGDIMAGRKGEFGLLAGDIVSGLTHTLMELVD